MNSKIYTKTMDIFPVSISSNMEIPVLSTPISAGFPSPALDFIDLSIDMNKYLIKRPTSTFYGRVKGQSMKDVGISDGDLLVIDKSIAPKDDQVAVCYLDGEFTLKKIKLEKDICWLIPANEAYQPIQVTSQNDFLIWGIVTHVIKAF